jgi:hypothetical protein
MESSESPLLPVPSNEDVAPELPSLEHAHASAFDLKLARFSLLIRMISFALMGLVSNPWVFTVASTSGEVGSGFQPALLSVALEVYMQREHRIRGEGRLMPVEVGKLYGSLSVVQAVW